MRRRYRSSRQGDAAVLFLLLVGGAFYVVTQVGQFVYENALVFTVIGLVVGGIVLAISVSKRRQRRRAIEEETARRLEYERQLEARLAVVRVSDNRADYVISNDDYRRGTPRENFYRKAFVLPLLSIFGNRCAGCGTSQNGVDLDHFVFSKNEGGSFAMFHRDGFWINNAIPLCETCNRSKLDRVYRDFFTPEQLVEILEKNREMTRRLNDDANISYYRPAMLLSPVVQRGDGSGFAQRAPHRQS